MIIKLSGKRKYQIDMSAAYKVIQNPTGLPVPVGIFLNELKIKDNNENFISKIK